MSTAPASAKREALADAAPGNGTLSPSMFAAPGKRALLLSLLVALFTLATYKQATHSSFINFDDDRYVTQNSHVQSGLTSETVKWALTATSEANWHPLTWMSHALDFQFYGLNPAGHHLTSILLHALNAVLLFLLLWQGTGRMGLGFFVALIFALHPVNVESVAWVAERKNVLSTMFFLLTLGAYGWYARKPDWKRYAAVVSLFVCGLASKPMLVTLPFLLLLLDYWPLGRMPTRQTEGAREPGQLPLRQTLRMLLIEKLPLLAISAASAVITIRAQRAGGAVIAATFPFGVRVKNALYCYLQYAWKAVWPVKLAPLYPHPGYSLSTWKAALALLFLIGASAFVVKFRSRRYLPVGWLWFLGTLVPVIGIVQAGNQAMADRYAYIPLIGLFLMIVWGVADLAGHAKLHLGWKVVPAGLVLVALAIAAYRQTGYWRTSLDLWGHTLDVTTNNFVAEDQFGGALVEQGRTDEAYTHFLRAARLAPADPVSHTNIGYYLYQHGQAAEAIPYFKYAVTLTSDTRVLATAYANLGSAYYELDDYDDSLASFDRSLQLSPNQYSTWLGMGLLAERQNKLQDAMHDFALSLRLQPTVQGYLGLGRCLAATDHKNQALTAYELALKISPNNSEAERAISALGQ